MNSEYGEWKLVKSQFSSLVSAMAVFKGICFHLKMKVISVQVHIQSLGKDYHKDRVLYLA